ncbi:MAG: ATP-binding cassette domain-containing protein [Planctomycetia bacterium]|nr:ATP-binding cassette domain-containing protein [Planctomycetia bacterium]
MTENETKLITTDPGEPVEGQVVTTEDGRQQVVRRRRSLLEMEDVSVQFGSANVLRDINLKVRRGETVAVIGESGCGKTVLLKTLIGLIWPTSGRVWFGGKDLARLSMRDLTKTRLQYGFVFQQAALFDSMTVGENISFPIRQRQTQLTKAEIRDRICHLLEEVGLSPGIINRMPAELSGGMRKRVGFARALVMEPELMLYDEPTTGLDPIMSDVINELIIGARDNHHVTGILVTHDMKSAKKVADRIVMMYPTSRLAADAPQIIYDGPPDAVETCPDKRVRQFVLGYAGDRVMEMAQHHKNMN